MTEDEFFDALEKRVPRIRLTQCLIACCVVVFALEQWKAGWVWSLPSPVLLQFGGVSGLKVQEGEVWRLLTAIFAHGSLLHIGLNMLSLWQAGLFIERIYGRCGMLVLYFGSGLLGSLASIWWKAQTLSVGASGAIFGLYGALLVWLLQNRQRMPGSLFNPMRSTLIVFMGYSLFAGFTLEGIDNAAHIGGLLAGVLMALSVQRPIAGIARSPWRQKRFWLGTLALLCCATFLWVRAPKTAITWQRKVEFAEITQSLALHDAVLNQQLQAVLQGLRQRQLMPMDAAELLETRVIPAWQQQIERLGSEEVNEADRERHHALLRYTTLRLQGLQMLAEGLRSGRQSLLQQAEQHLIEAQSALIEARAAQNGPSRAP
ncbi:rhomboid family intramembrane serine protease [Viridibacterium curvum]|uniref:Peptidase S54 rhomboid domain-containing protein n=1 Tax=Viridibacterium curvum TaxID=1101404 RepID=A0ABP9Q5P8_9RHOO